ncbi:hypothetical protein O6R05_02280 [Peptoniphilus equinus]|uniref:DUF5050 domain-containing protein n=1 Tax=Peptoniphilus equinus TaxID=3016343 RepID=A0ABY7QUD7_9FIRM|nr:hypothetical protein [Peptoniphilus equinus]WBW50391.1 hypothetical protein O6R05_02280 [Peptoniphilus equinus]
MNKIKLIVVCALLFISQRAYAVTTPKVTVQIPTFDVTINDVAMEKENSEYPVLVYRDITYFPMTYKNARFLGLDTLWDKDTATLHIVRSTPQGTYYAYPGKRNPMYDTANAVNFNIMLNGKKVYPGSQYYPLLVYRDVTYFPLTWQFCRDEFKWTYSFDDVTGLQISSEGKTDEKGIGPPRGDYMATEIDGIQYVVERHRGTAHIILSKVEGDKVIELKEIDKIANHVILDNHQIYFTVDDRAYKTVNRFDIMTMTEDVLIKVDTNSSDNISMTALNGHIYYKTSLDYGALCNENGKKLNEAGALTGLRRTDDYVFATFDKGDNLLVFDKNQQIIARGKGNINVNTVTISEGVVTYIDETTGAIKEVRF